MTPMPHPPYSPDLAPYNIFPFVSQDENRPQRETFVHVEDVKQKKAEALKVIKADEFKNCFEQWKKMSQ